MAIDIYDLYLIFLAILFFGVFHLLFKSEMDIYFKIVLAPIIIISFLIIFFIGLNIINPTRKPFFVIKNLSNDTVFLNFYKSKEDKEWIKYKFSIKQDYSKIENTYTNRNLKEFIHDSISIATFLNDYGYRIIPSSKIHKDSIFFMSQWYNTDSNLMKSPLQYFLNDPKQILLLQNNIISIYLPPYSTFVKRTYKQFYNPVPIELSFPNAQLIDIKKRDKLLYRISKNNFKYIMKKEEVMKEKDSYVLEIK